ncbi:MAG: hypothetical protein D6729_14425 [Deltaproteobacteria bacterium]|nr:MAG: hypothetical protein D6729_14425 [Deltaproteobacteria bacterium]
MGLASRSRYLDGSPGVRTRALGLGAAALVSAALLGCPPNPYGPSSDERLDMATSGIDGVPTDIEQANAAHLAELASYACEKEQAVYQELSGPGAAEDEKLAGFTGLLRQLREKREKMTTLLEQHPGLRYHVGKAADGKSYDVPALLGTCEQTLLGTETELDALIREILEAPIVYEYTGKGRRRRRVATARIDFDLLAAAVTTLAPADSDLLMSKIDGAKKRLEEESRGGRRRRR